MPKVHQLQWLAPLLALGLGLARAQDPRPAGYSPRANAEFVPEEEPKTIGADELWGDPSAYVGQLLKLDVQFGAELKSWNPLLTRFGPGDYRGFQAWSEDQYLWHKSEFGNPAVRVYAKRGGAAEWALQDAQRFARFELLCRVQSNFAGLPWVEVLAVKPKIRSLQPGCMNHAVRGLEFVEKELWKAALDEFERADSDGIPKRAHEELVRLADLCRKRIPIVLGERVNR